ncbi:MAG: hypothetical protein L0Y71_21415 [Gemmataceae bacterium]|nr:hypothetical protein [Gemmataceae bacterium]
MRRLHYRWLLAVLVAAGIGTFAGLRFYDAQRQARLSEVNAALATIGRLGGNVKYERRGPDLHVVELRLIATRPTVEDLRQLTTLADVRKMNLSGCPIDDESLPVIAAFRNLEILYLATTNITDDGVKALRSLTKLSDLSLANTAVTDACLDHVGALAELRHLQLLNTAAGDAGLRRLHSLRKLETLYLQGTNVTDAGVAELEKALPGVTVYR